MKKVNHLKFKIALTTILIIILAVYIKFDIPCVFLSLFHFPCVGCGMTRAWYYASHFDFFNAFRYNSAFWTVPIFYLLLIFDGKIFKNERHNKLLIIGLVIALVTSYAMKLIIPSQINLFL